MHGSRTGFYADDSAAAVCGDPGLVRTANLRDADLRGARLDPALREQARAMRAFID